MTRVKEQRLLSQPSQEASPSQRRIQKSPAWTAGGQGEEDRRRAGGKGEAGGFRWQLLRQAQRQAESWHQEGAAWAAPWGLFNSRSSLQQGLADGVGTTSGLGPGPAAG